MPPIRVDSDGWEYASGVEFSAEVFRGKYVCAACHSAGNAIRIRYPETLYYDRVHLETMTQGVFLCDRCAAKLLTALNNPIDKEARQ